MEIGAYLEIDGRSAIRFVRHYPHPVERVWAAVTVPAELVAWFPSAVEIELRPGGTVSFSGDPHVAGTTGTVIAVDPPHLLVFTWGRDELHFELEYEGDGCRFTLTNVLDSRETAARNGSGWTICLAELGKHLDGVRSRGPHSDDALRFDPIYRAHIDAGVPSGAPIPER